MYMAVEFFRSNWACAQYSHGVFPAGTWPGNSNAGCGPKSLGASVHFRHSAGWQGFPPCLLPWWGMLAYSSYAWGFSLLFWIFPQLCALSSYFCKKHFALPGGFELLCQDWSVTLIGDGVWFLTCSFFFLDFCILLKARCCSWRSSYVPCKTVQHIEINED